MSQSATLHMSQLARDLTAQGKDIISLSIGEPDFETPDFIKKAAYQAMEDGYTHYSPVPGEMELRKAISAKFKKENNLDYAPDQIMVSNGAKQSIYNICMSTLNKGDEVVVFTPYWVSYHDIVDLIGGKVVEVIAEIENDFKVLPEQVERAITEKTKLIIFSSPCNPTGSVYTSDELKAIAAVLKDKDLLIVSDEIYEHINFIGGHVSIGSFDAVKEKTVTVNGFSKGYAMTGWRLGYFGGPVELVTSSCKIQGQVTSGAASFSQIAGAKALVADLPEIDLMRDAFRKRRDLVVELLSDIPGIKCNKPEGAFYVFPDISAFIGKKSPEGRTISNSKDFCEYILYTGNVALVQGSAFGLENHFRLSYATSQEQLKEAIRRIKDAVEGLRG